MHRSNPFASRKGGSPLPRVLLSFGAALLLAGVVSLVVPHTAPAQRRPPGLRSQDPNAAYCVASGGQVVNRQPFFNTNGPQSDWLQLMGDQDFCEFTSPTDGS